jgi:hypothetical protein
MNDDVITLLRRHIDENARAVDQLQKELETRRATLDKYRAALGVLEELPEEPAHPNGAAHPPEPSKDEPLPKSIKYASVEVLRRNGDAMTLQDIADEMLRLGFEYERDKKQLRTTIGVNLERRKADGWVEKVALATYRLTPVGERHLAGLIEADQLRTM